MRTPIQTEHVPFWRTPFSPYRIAKRIIDIVVASTALILLAPLFLVVALLIKRFDGGPVFFVQRRVGRKGRLFNFPKFRSMRADAEALKHTLWDLNEHSDGVIFKMKSDPRVTPIGRFIRKYSIDEVPQLLCVLKGEMTLVGPRPPVPTEVVKYDSIQRRRLDVTPGLTCLWQISGRSDLSFSEQVRLDIEYIEKRNLLLDARILLRTVPAVFSARGAY